MHLATGLEINFACYWKNLSITALFSQDASTFSTSFILFVFETFQVELYFLPVAFCFKP